jgi:hypothetical protein
MPNPMESTPWNNSSRAVVIIVVILPIDLAFSVMLAIFVIAKFAIIAELTPDTLKGAIFI